MPKLKMGEEELKNRKIVALIKYHKELCGYTVDQIAGLSGINSAMIFYRYNRPYTFRIDELRRLAKCLNIDKNEFIDLL